MLILVFGPISGAHLNLAVSLVDWGLSRTGGSHQGGLRVLEVLAYIAAQSIGGLLGASLANLMYDLPAIQVSQHHRATSAAFLAEVVATAGLIL